MRISGKKIEGSYQTTIVIPRGDSPKDYIVFEAQAIRDFTELEALVPRPRPAVKILKGGRREVDTNSPGYQDALQDYAEKRVSWIVLKSLSATPDLEWETVDMGKPQTWKNFEDELRDSGFSGPEIRRIMDGCMQVNGLDDEKLESARSDFLAFLQQQKEEELSSQEDEPASTQSGDAANDSE